MVGQQGREEEPGQNKKGQKKEALLFVEELQSVPALGRWSLVPSAFQHRTTMEGKFPGLRPSAAPGSSSCPGQWPLSVLPPLISQAATVTLLPLILCAYLIGLTA